MPDRIVLAHGGGGSKMRDLIEGRFVPAYGGTALAALGDGAVIAGRPGRIAFATDSFVVRPYVFPGGDIGELAVNGTVNDVAMCGARPAFLSVGMILEEGLPLADLDRISASIARAARAAGVEIATGDTKVVERG
ncbi:MAG: hydrogenase expression/formation protein HypE, partial [Planctomycetes bacterium]|nr:hydrogenase expression/formation protein HypE [Planctomycetota bacterium]